MFLILMIINIFDPLNGKIDFGGRIFHLLPSEGTFKVRKFLMII